MVIVVIVSVFSVAISFTPNVVLRDYAPIAFRSHDIALWSSLLLVVVGNILGWTTRSRKLSRVLIWTTLWALLLFVLNILFLPALQVA